MRTGPDGVTIYILSNGVHTWIVMPKVNQDMDWRLYAQPQHLRDPRWGNADHVAIGYGNRDFYLNTPTWGDLTMRCFHCWRGHCCCKARMSGSYEITATSCWPSQVPLLS